ncbi:MAG: MFS transporter [Caldilineaceae bacterium]|nr:MFS transporter [Caldilineaceae bacterium]
MTPESTTSVAPARIARPAWLVALVAAVVGLSIQGDSLLYGILPLAAEGLGIPLGLVGLLLSANRLVRLVSNTWASTLYEKFGPRLPFIASAVLGFLTALIYSAGWGVVVFVLARMAWGVAWSGLRQGGYQAVWTGGPGVAGRLMGLLWGIIRLGSAISVVVGGWIFDQYGYHPAVLVIAGITALAIPLAWAVRWPEAATHRPVSSASSATPSKTPAKARSLEGWRVALADPAQRWMLFIGLQKLLFDSILVSTAALFLKQQLGSETPLAAFGIGIGTAAGLVLALRWLSDLVVGPLLGALSDRMGQLPLAALLVVGILIAVIGAVTLGGVASLLCIALILIASTGVNVTLDAAANRLSVTTPRPHLFIGAYTTVSDAGSAVGPLLAYSLGAVTGFGTLYVAAALVQAVAVTLFWWRSSR